MIRFDFADFLVLMFGTDDLTSVVAGFVFALIGCVISISIRVARGIKQNEDTPNKFSLDFYWRNNWFSFLVGFALTLSAMRFSVELTGAESTMWLAWVYGFLNYRLAELIENKINAIVLLMNKLSDKITNLFKTKKDDGANS